MHIYHISSTLSWQEIEKQLENSDCLILDVNAVHSLEALQLAYALAQKSFKQKKNLAKQFKFEFLLWLGGTRDIKNALQKLGAKNPGDMLLVTFGNEKQLLKKLEAKKKSFALKKQTTWQELEEIALSMI